MAAAVALAFLAALIFGSIRELIRLRFQQPVACFLYAIADKLFQLVLDDTLV